MDQETAPVNEGLRNRILDDLSEHFSRDILSVDEYERRVQAIYKATTDLELVKINEDLLPPQRYAASQPAAPHWSKDGPEHQQCIAIFSGSTLKGEFAAPTHLDTIAIFGGSDVDLRDAHLPPGGMDIEVAAIFGGVDIKLPADCDFQIQVTAIFGGVNHPPFQKKGNRPLVRIHGAAVFGGVDIKQA